MILQELLKDDLKKLNDLIVSYYQCSNITLLHKVVENLIYAGGKRIRPLLTLVLCKIFNYTDSNAVNAAAAIELIHTATLLHDDVVDEADMRRGVKTAKNIWGNKTSILVGDFLLSVAFKCAISCNHSQVLRILSDATLIIAEGEIQQLINVNNLELTREEYLGVISAKTAKLFEAACAISAHLIKRDDKLLSEFGYSLGIAFQIIDDIIDYQGNTGKDIGKDFYNGKVTLPVIIAYQEANSTERQFWQRCIKDKEIHTGDLEQAIEYLHKHEAIKRSLEIAKTYTDKCHHIMTTFPQCEATNILYKTIQAMI